MTNLSNLPLVLYLASVPLISAGTTAGRPGLTWIGFLALLSASFITPALRLKSNEEADPPATEYDKSGDKS